MASLWVKFLLFLWLLLLLHMVTVFIRTETLCQVFSLRVHVRVLLGLCFGVCWLLLLCLRVFEHVDLGIGLDFFTWLARGLRVISTIDSFVVFNLRHTFWLSMGLG